MALRTGPVRGPGRRLRPWRTWALRTRMVVAIAALAGVGLVFADIAGMTLLRNQLIHQVDDRLHGAGRYPPGIPTAGPGSGTTGPGGAGGGTGGGTGTSITSGANGDSWPVHPENLPHSGPETLFLRYSSAGILLSTVENTTDLPQLGSAADLKAHADTQRPYTVDGTEGPWRVVVASRADGSEYGVVAASLGYIQTVESQLLVIDAAVSALVLLLIALAAASVVRIGLRPLTRMEGAAAAIAAGDLSRRVEDADPHTESGRLGTALNAMLVRIEAALAVRTASERRMRQFLADASHELRTPLTSIRGFAELYRRGGTPPGPALDEAMGRIEAEVDRMRLLVTDLLMLARMDEERPLLRRPVDLLEVAADAVSDAHVRVPTRFVMLDGFGTLEPVTVPADEARIRQVVTNLLSNALQHTPDDAQVVVRVGVPADEPQEPDGEPIATVGPEPPSGVTFAAIEVADTGTGMSTVDASRVFERLYRADPSRTRAGGGTGGAGLGLAIVAAIVTAHGGRVLLWTAPGKGARFRALLPMAGAELRADSEHF